MEILPQCNMTWPESSGKLANWKSLQAAVCVALIIAFLPWEFILDKDVKTPELVDSIPIFNHQKKHTKKHVGGLLILVGGFKYFYFHPYLGKWIPFEFWLICFKWVGSNHQLADDLSSLQVQGPRIQDGPSTVENFWAMDLCLRLRWLRVPMVHSRYWKNFAPGRDSQQGCGRVSGGFIIGWKDMSRIFIAWKFPYDFFWWTK